MDHTGKNWTSLELDKCHGHVDAHLERYVYRATHDFPYILGCYHGKTLINNMQTMLPPPGGMMPPGNGTGGMMPPGNGTHPLPPPGRRKRHDSASMNAVHSGEFVRFDKERNQVRYRRQMFPSNNPCLNVANPNWQQNTCYAWCNIPSSGNFDNCPYGPKDINVNSTNSSSPVPIADFKDPVNAGHLLICNALYTMVAITMYFIQ
ncbi:hypothetical protein DPMN_123186 [Dreissena polymorpha]|uniref:Uncharacterized protein n=1 Tax=Dreissena polymorpha TaxID=45954 RepID=A0A9D4JV47_DREPO|nr:hypothetical protein DPMN_123186 [Dreissena polymorpha]